MRISSLTFSIAASLLLLGFAGQAHADLSCAQRNLPEFSRDLNKNTVWNNYVSTQLSAPASQWPGWVQLKNAFQTQQCATAWGSPNTYTGVTQRSCSFDAPTPRVSGTTVNYQAPSLSTAPNAVINAIVKLRGCGGVVRLPDPIERVH